MLKDDELVKAIATSEPIDLEVTDPGAAAEAIVRRIISSASADEVSEQAEAGALHAADVLGRPLLLQGVSWSSSGFENGPQVYALVSAIDTDTGELLSITCGSRNVMAALFRLGQLGAFPMTDPWVIVEADNPTAGGFRPMWLKKA